MGSIGTGSTRPWIRQSPSFLLAMLVLGAAIAVAILLAVAATDVAAKKKPKIDVKVNGTTLNVDGTEANETIALRLRPGHPGTLVVDVGNDGSEDFRIDRTRFTTIVVHGGDGADTLLVDEANGVFTTTESTTLHGDAGADHLTGDVGALTLDGGPGDDTIGGSDAADIILGGDGADTLDGNRGDDVVLAGAGDDTIVWDPGDASDVVEGQAGSDTLLFNGANVSEGFDVSANGGRVRFFRNVGNVTMDLDDVEHLDLLARGGADALVVHDLTGTDLGAFDVDLAGIAGSGIGDAAADTVTVEGTAGDDAITVSGSSTDVSVTGLAASVAIHAAEFANDQLDIETGAGTDTVDHSGLPAGIIQLLVDGAPA